VGRNHSTEVGARRAAVCKRCDGCGMGADRATHADDQAAGAPARDRIASGAGRDLVYRADRLPVADAAEGLPAVHDCARLFLPHSPDKAAILSALAMIPG
jgi:hypothetical protein